MPSRGRLTGLLLVSTLLLCSCSLPLVSESPPGIPPESVTGLNGSELVPPPSLLKYYDWLQGQPRAAQKREYDVSHANFDAEPNALNRLRLALVLCLPDTPFRDYATARSLMTDYLDDAANERAENRGLALLILGFIERNAQLQRQRAVAEQQLRKEQEIRVSLEERVAQLEIQVEQLKAIEDSLMETEQSINVPAPPATSND
jgi:hypothetical protein